MSKRQSPTSRPASLEARAEELANTLRRQIRHYLPDSQLPSQARLVRQFGVSTRVVRRALKLLQAEGLVRARPRSGIRVLDRARQQPAIRQVSAILLRREAPETFCQSILLGADGQARRHGLGFEVVLCDDVPCDTAWLEQLDRKTSPASGWAFIETRPSEDLLAAWRQQGRSVVLIDQPNVSHQAHTVNSDGLGAAFATTERLLLLGHRHIAYIGTVRPPTSQPVNRIQGFRLAHQRHRVDVQESLILDIHYRDLRADDLRRLIESTSPRPTAVLAANQHIGCQALLACDQLGLHLPDDLSIASCGMQRRDLPAELLGRLSRCNEGPPEELGHLAVEVLCGPHSNTGANLTLAPIDWQDHGSIGPPPSGG